MPQTYNKPFVIAEIGCNHKGNIEIAKELIKVAKIFCNVDAVKFQKRNNKELLTEEQYNQPHPNPSNSYGETYGLHREFLEFSVQQHAELKQYEKDPYERRAFLYLDILSWLESKIQNKTVAEIIYAKAHLINRKDKHPTEHL